MINTFFADSLSEAFMKVVAACFPLVAIGFVTHHHVLTIAAGCTGGVALVAFFIRVGVLFVRPAKRNPLLDRIVHGLFFPYAFSLAFAAGIADGEKNGWYGIWFALFLAAWIILGNCVVAKKENVK